MAFRYYRCPYCARDDFTSARGLTQHQNTNRLCRTLSCAFVDNEVSENLAHRYVPLSTATINQSRPDSGEDKNNSEQEKEVPLPPPSPIRRNLQNDSNVSIDHGVDLSMMSISSTESNDYDDLGVSLLFDDDNCNDFTKQPQISSFDQSIRRNFKDYVEYAQHTFEPFDKIERNSIMLLSTLRRTKASLDTYEDIMEWHLRCNGHLNKQQRLSQTTTFYSRERLFTKLRNRYNSTADSYGRVQTIILPHSKAKANLVINDAATIITSLLTDPRIKDEDYLFFGNNPFSPPPDTLDYIADLNTGLSYTETYKKLIKKPGKQVLLPVIFYIDGANTGHFAQLPITAVKIALGIFTRVARDQDHFWRILGYIPAISKHKSRGRRLVLDSQHVDSVMANPDMLDEEGGAGSDSVSKAQDLHSMLDVILKDYIKLQETGFIWDLVYDGELYENVEFVLFTPFFKVDGDEADKLCGKYTSRTAKVKNLCRYCECPTPKTDYCLAEYPLKTPAKIQEMVDTADQEGLRQISQQLIQNSTYKLRFGQHNNLGIHGACPSEMLHALLLGIFKYVRDCFFEQLGPTSKLADDINGLSRSYGFMLSRQSQRDLPKTTFANGIRRGKLMAKEYPGILLCMAVILRCNAGREKLLRKKSVFTPNSVEDWLVMVETLLQWESWLKSPVLQKTHVRACRHKHRYMMYLIKKVGKRVEGMGLKIMKFHAITHMAMDMENFGVPMEFDTGSNERGHKVTKTAARLTQRNEETFDYQTANRLHEIHLLEMALAEIEGRPLWEYYENTYKYAKNTPNPEKPHLAGSKIHLDYDYNTNKNLVYVLERGKNKYLIMEQQFVDFVDGLKRIVGNNIPGFCVRTEHKRNNVIFRASTLFRGKVWRDWVMVDWGEEGVLPCQIWGFVDLRALSPEFHANYGYADLQPEIYAIVESASVLTGHTDGPNSELFVPLVKQVGGFTHDRVSHFCFYLAEVESFVKPVVVVPNIGGETNHYLMLKDREDWKLDFMDWLEDKEEIFEDSDNEEEDAAADYSTAEDSGGESLVDSEGEER